MRVCITPWHNGQVVATICLGAIQDVEVNYAMYYLFAFHSSARTNELLVCRYVTQYVVVEKMACSATNTILGIRHSL